MKVVNVERYNQRQNKLIEEAKRKESIKKDMKNSPKYIDWLINFTKENPIFSDDDWNYHEEDLSKEDYQRVRDLSLLFAVVDDFANRNYLSSEADEWGESYNINKDDVYLTIGFNAGQGTSFYCERTEPKNGSINFYSIMNKNLPMRTEFVDTKLKELSDELKTLMVQLNVPVSSVEEMVSYTQKEAEKEKRYTKK